MIVEILFNIYPVINYITQSLHIENSLSYTSLLQPTNI